MALLMERWRWEQRNLAIAVRRRGCWWCLGSCRRDSSNDDGLDAGGKENWMQQRREQEGLVGVCVVGHLCTRLCRRDGCVSAGWSVLAAETSEMRRGGGGEASYA